MGLHFDEELPITGPAKEKLEDDIQQGGCCPPGSCICTEPQMRYNENGPENPEVKLTLLIIALHDLPAKEHVSEVLISFKLCQMASSKSRCQGADSGLRTEEGFFQRIRKAEGVPLN